MTSAVPFPPSYVPSLPTLLFQLKSLRQQNPSLQPIDPLLQQLDEYGESFNHSAQLICLELSQVSHALTALVAMLDQSGLETLEREQMYCLLEPFARRLQQTTVQMQELA
ncbi:hypothetical protein [Chromobacterium haemolyticum]|uniref:hypothetical protein n=1 Tax=Chromobacterium haemolyticum TaxID=394935 RepID=UPI000D30BF1E|nr:hypothetical protein [Chromobacterium haemolyticum]PTU69037.1 hypothetical protein DBB33_06065 [Chromobacterium haemolyticum]